ncbi:GNAT family N-acetyltransferase [Anaerobacillus sp. CMMVII]|uniref:GNAT family N-acetyltransferase n=1 Tax=Anaerobacillus sp. CMMVII TaxID=2755588 RepID=UPI0021B7AEC3|nr:GNAT family N-acetyltransferase [Anaerobacillus sp. CMMVII]MCT8138304.1 GNAT family N-acetyltransferase [Anaerobacillus sp. CMMVII]
MEIRKLNPSDAKQYVKLRLEALRMNPEAFGSSYEEEKDNPIELYEGRLRSETSYHFGAFVHEQLIGVVSLVKETKQKFRHRANIFAMYVTPSKRGCGIGKGLMQRAIETAKDLDEVEQLHLSVVTTNESARKLYLSLGFNVYGYDKRALNINNLYFDEEHMVKFL